MKKAILATAVVMVVAFISTICFGVALGSQGLRALLKDGGILENWSQEVSDWHDMAMYGEGMVDTDNRTLLFNSESVELPAKETLKITADCAEIRVLCGTGETVEVVLEQYSARANPTTKYTLSVLSDTEIHLDAADDLDGVVASLLVYVPQNLQSLTVENGLGETELEDITADSLSVHLATGDLDLRRVTVKTADLRVELGDVHLENTVTASESLRLYCACGNVDFEIPATAPFTLRYKVQTGNVETDDSIPREMIRSINRAGSTCEGELARASAEGAVGGLYEITAELGNLEIESHRDAD